MANAAGRLSEDQSRDQRQRLKSEGTWLVVGSTAFFAICWACHFAFPPVFTGFVVVLCVLGLLDRAADLSRGKVLTVTGVAWGEFVPDSDGPDSYYVNVAGTRLETTKLVFIAMRPGGPIVAHYLPTGKRLVSLAALPGWRPSPQPAQKRRWSISLG